MRNYRKRITQAAGQQTIRSIPKERMWDVTGTILVRWKAGQMKPKLLPLTRESGTKFFDS